jgi:predicted DNA-binding transcriptional regulator YafY
VPVPVRRRIVGPSGVSVDHLRATVARLRRAQSAIRTAQTRSGELVPEGEPVRLPGEVLVALAGAVDAGRAVQIAYVNLEGRSSLRVVHPLLLSGGYLTAYDEQTGERRTFAVSRISALVVLAE